MTTDPHTHTHAQKLHICRLKGGSLTLAPISYSSIEAYTEATHMDRDCAWGTEITFAHLLHTPVLLYNTEHANWFRYSLHGVDVRLNDDVILMSMYLWHPPGHFEVVRSIRK